jgi:hypothetical protein
MGDLVTRLVTQLFQTADLITRVRQLVGSEWDTGGSTSGVGAAGCDEVDRFRLRSRFAVFARRGLLHTTQARNSRSAVLLKS